MECFECGKDAVIYLPYTNKNLCKKHFVKMFEKRFRKTVREFNFIKKNDIVVVGLSGGKDSTVLLHLLASLRKDLPFKLKALTIDEGIKNYRPKTMKVAKKEAKKLNVPLTILSFKKEAGKTLDEIFKKKKELPCSYCGVIRRYLLNKGSKKLKATKLAIGHNLDDVAQTVLMNVMRNEPLRLVRYNEPLIQDKKFIPRIRPLMRTPEKEIAVYAMLKGIDITHIPCPYAEFAFRQDIRRVLNELEEKYPGNKFRIANSFISMQKWMKEGLKNEKFELDYCPQCKEPSSEGKCMYCSMMEKLG